MENEEQQVTNQEQPNTAQDEGTQDAQQDQSQGAEVTFTDEQQAAINDLVAKTIAKERQKAEAQAKAAQAKADKERQDAVEKAEARAKMSAEERAEAERKDREKAIEEERQSLARERREFATKNLLLDKGISTDMLPLVMGKDDSETSDRLDLLNKFVEGEVHKATQKLLQGKSNPTNGDGAGVPVSDNPWSKSAWNLTKQQQILNSNPEQARQLIAQAKPTGFYIH